MHAPTGHAAGVLPAKPSEQLDSAAVDDTERSISPVMIRSVIEKRDQHDLGRCSG